MKVRFIMRYKIIVAIAFSGTLNFGFAQTNIFPYGNNGKFETSGSTNDFRVAGSPSYTISRSSTYKYAGSYSMKLTPSSQVLGNGYAYTGPSIYTVEKDAGYLFRVKIYVPSSSGLNVGAKIFWDWLPSHQSLCNGGSFYDGFTVGTDPYNQWVDKYHVYIPEGEWGGSGLGYTFNELYFDVMQITSAGDFYLDNIELFKFYRIKNDNGVVDQVTRSITLAPTGGISGVAYKYQWNDGYTGKDRINLLPGNYSVTIGHAGYPICDYTFNFNFPAPAPTVENLTPTRCVGQGAQMTASSTVSGATYTWYNAQTGGSHIGDGNVLIIPPYQAAGTYNYYVQTNINGVSSTRTKAIITVYNNPSGVTTSSPYAYPGKAKTFTAISHKTGDQYAYNFGDGITFNTIASSVNHTYTNLGQYTVTVTTTNPNGNCSKVDGIPIEVRDYIALCNTAMPSGTGGAFKLDKYSGQVVFDKGDSCTPPLTFGCVEGKVEAPQLTNVVSASATTFSDKWNYKHVDGAYPDTKNYENGQLGKWRPEASYTFNTPINYQSNDKNYTAGRYTLSNFNWQNPGLNAKTGWILANKVTKYSPNGDPVEEVNALNIASTAKFGYGGSVPYLIAQNAEYKSVMFEGFENVYPGDMLEEQVALQGGTHSTTSHSGKHALQLTGQFSSRSISPNGKAIQVRFWASGDVSAGTVSVTSSVGSASDITRIARSGTWSLWESTIPATSSEVIVTLNKLGVGSVWIDDLRIQPVDAEMTCYVYQPGTLRLLAVFDDQHFGLFYQYNDEGKLVRKQVETERGVKTIQETQYNVPSK
jgi:PKD repeat protein